MKVEIYFRSVSPDGKISERKKAADMSAAELKTARESVTNSFLSAFRLERK